MKRFVLSLICAVLLAGSIAAQPGPPQAPNQEPEITSQFRIPLLYSRIVAQLPNGIVQSRWSFLLNLWSATTVSFPTGDEMGMRMIIPFWMNSWNDMNNERVLSFPFPIPLVIWGSNDTGQTRYIFPFVKSDAVERNSGLSQTIRAIIPLWWSQERAPADKQQEQSWRMRHAMGLQGQQVPWAPAVDRLAILNFFHSVKTGFDREGEDLTLDDWGVFPLTWGWRNEDLSHINLHPLIYWQPDRKFSIFPLYTRSATQHSLIPIWGRGEGRVNPSGNDPDQVQLQHEWNFFLFPLWRQVTQTRNEDEVNQLNLVLWPIFAWGEGGFKSERRVWPLFRTAREWYGDTEVESSHALWPFIWWGQRTEEGEVASRHRVVFPLYWDMAWGNVTEESADRDLDVLFPLWVRMRDQGELTDLWAPFPLFHRMVREDFRSTRLGILLGGHRTNADGSTLMDIGTVLFRMARDEDHVDTSTLLLLLNTDRNWTEDTTHVSVLWRLFEYTRNGDDRGVRLLYLPWRIPLPGGGDED